MSMTSKWYPVIDYDLCISDLKCVEFCRNGVIVEQDGRPVVVQPDNCVEFCQGCAKICPQDAITYAGTSAEALKARKQRG